MPTEVDVAVVGGGPSGAAAAHYLASRGHSVLVCEKKSFPREKTCGDGLTPRAVKALQAMGLGDRLGAWEKVDGLRVHAAGKTMELPFPKLDRWEDYGLVKPRKALDKIVLDNAERAGAKVLYQTQVTQPVFADGRVSGFKAQRDGDVEEVEAKFVVCAEGAATKFAKALGRVRKADYPMGLAIRQYFRSDPLAHSGWFDAFLDVRSGDDNVPGYGWVFPVGDGSVNVGVGLLSTYGGWQKVNLHHLQRDFVSTLSPEWQIDDSTVCSKERGGRLFMGQSVWPPAGPGFLMTGDAAGMINPCNGEGIAYGYETGRIAGRHMDEALRDGKSYFLSDYTKELEETYGAYYRLGRRFVKVIGHPGLMERLISVAMNSRQMMEFALTMLANLEDVKPGGMTQKGFKFMKKLAEVKW